MGSDGTTSATSKPDFLLHTYYRSTCSGRLRIALNLKDVSTQYVYIHLYKGEQQSAQHVELNPSGSVPVLTHLTTEGGLSFPIGQSVAAMEYLEEVFPDRAPLLPPHSQRLERAKVRTLVNIVTNDIQPITNRRITKAVTELGADPTEWSMTYMTRGLQAYETIASKTASKYSVGDRPSMANVCLVPAVWAAERYGVELDKLPTVMRVYRTLSELEAVQSAHWSVQEDCPPDKAWL